MAIKIQGTTVLDDSRKLTNITDYGNTVTEAEIGRLSGVTSAIQTQIDSKLAIANKATQAEADTGTDDSVYMTPLKTRESLGGAALLDAPLNTDLTVDGGDVAVRSVVAAAVAAGPSPVKAWVTFNGITKTIISGFNVSSLTNRGGTKTTINFTNPMQNTNYAVVPGIAHGVTNKPVSVLFSGTNPLQTNSVTIATGIGDFRFTSPGLAIVSVIVVGE